MGLNARAGPSVAVVIPMYNAEETVEDTLRSVRGQDYRNLEIIVVDDGSADRSAEIVERHMAEDGRIRLIRQPNGGVAAARNRGAAATDALYLAFVDADDLWSPHKISLQMAAMESGGDRVGLVHCWFAQIDEAGRMFPLWRQKKVDGDALHQLCRTNFIGNGSSLLISRAAFEAAGGYDASLRARRAQGCEDVLMGLRIAEHFEFRTVPEYLIGYRQSSANMSSDVMQMMRSNDIVMNEYRRKFPHYRADLRIHSSEMMAWLTLKASQDGRFLAAFRLLWRLCWTNPPLGATRLRPLVANFVRLRVKPVLAKIGVKRVRTAKAQPPRPLFTEEFR